MARSVEDYLLKIQLQVQNDRALKQLTANLEKTAKAAPSVQRGMRTASASTRSFGNVAQNAGYQIQDFVVQVQGGVDPLRAMSQQLPQMTVGLGAWGAAIGLVVAAMPTLIALMNDGEEAARDWDEVLADLEASLSAMTDVSSGLDFDGWNENWNKATQAVKETELQLLRFRQSVAQANLDDAVRSLNSLVSAGENVGFVGESLARLSDFLPGLGFGSAEGAREYFGDVNLSEKFGIDRDTVDQVQALFESMAAGEVTAAEFQRTMLEITEQNPKATKEFRDLTQAVIDQAAAAEKLSQARAQLEAASNSLSTGVALPTGGGSGSSAPTDGPLPAVDAFIARMSDLNGIMVDYRIQANDYIQMQREVAENTPQATDAVADQVEGFSLAAEGVKLFDQSFETMLNGVLMGTRSLSDAFTDMAKVIIAQMLKLAAYKGIGTALSGSGGVLGEIGAAFLGANADGNVFDRGSVVPFARGGVVNGPTVFPMANGLGLMGEAGPEAVMPLKRGTDGKLGVAGGGMNVTINNMAAGVQVNARQGADGLTIDVVMRQLSDAISRGGNDLSSALEGTYSLGRGRGVY